MKIKRSIASVSGDLTVAGDVVLTDPNKGLVMPNQAAVEKRITVVTEEGVDTLNIKDA